MTGLTGPIVCGLRHHTAPAPRSMDFFQLLGTPMINDGESSIAPIVHYTVHVQGAVFIDSSFMPQGQRSILPAIYNEGTSALPPHRSDLVTPPPHEDGFLTIQCAQ